jgi:uncharacterized protein YndB with AHSA1/START domain
MTTPTRTETVQVYRVTIQATPEQIWEAITTPAFTARYFHGARITVTPERYLSIGTDDSIWGDAAVLEFDPPRRLVHGWDSRYDAELAQEPTSRVTWEIAPRSDRETDLTVTHDQLEQSPKTAASVSGPGWTGVLAGLKALLESPGSIGAQP